MKPEDLLLGELKEFKRYMTVELAALRKEVRHLHRFWWTVSGAMTALFILLELIHPIDLIELVKLASR